MRRNVSSNKILFDRQQFATFAWVQGWGTSLTDTLGATSIKHASCTYPGLELHRTTWYYHLRRVSRSWTVERSMKTHGIFLRLRPENQQKGHESRPGIERKLPGNLYWHMGSLEEKNPAWQACNTTRKDEETSENVASLVDPEGFLVVIVMSRLSETQKAMFLKAALLA